MGKVMESKRIIYLFGYSINIYKAFKELVKIIEDQVQVLSAEVSLVFLHDGVIGLSKKSEINPNLEKLMGLAANLFALVPDMKARGMDLNEIQEKIKLIDYNALVDLLVDHPKIVSWM